MANEPTGVASANQRGEQLRQLQHDLNGYLGVITMGMMALQGVRESPDDFAAMRTSIEEGGIQPLKEVIAKVVALAGEKGD